MSALFAAGNIGLLEELVELDIFHTGVNDFLRYASTANRGKRKVRDFSSFFPLPVEYFKSNTRPSVPNSEIRTWVTSSGTTGTPSRIPLDIHTSTAQMKAAAKTFGSVIGNVRRPLLIIDSSSILHSGGEHSARAAGSLAMVRMSSMHSWLLDEEHNVGELTARFSQQNHKPFVFGFTYMVYQHLFQGQCDFGDIFHGATLIHGGGWKKLERFAVSKEKFYRQLKERHGFARIVDYYGMVEQLGSVWLEAESDIGVFLPNEFSGAIIRDAKTLEVVTELGQPGLIQVFSSIPRSYPGHSLLTGDLGMLREVYLDGQRLIGLSVLGRMPSLEPRGCSDAIVDVAVDQTDD